MAAQKTVFNLTGNGRYKPLSAKRRGTGPSDSGWSLRGGICQGREAGARIWGPPGKEKKWGGRKNRLPATYEESASALVTRKKKLRIKDSRLRGEDRQEGREALKKNGKTYEEKGGEMFEMVGLRGEAYLAGRSTEVCGGVFQRQS